jgi:transposase
VPKPKTNPETEVVPTRQNDRRQRRRFSAEDKARILAEADACAERGQLGELLRRQGIYSTHLTNWRAQLKPEGVVGLVAKRRGPRPKRDDKDRVIEKLEKQNARLEKELRISKALIEMHKKSARDSRDSAAENRGRLVELVRLFTARDAELASLWTPARVRAPRRSFNSPVCTSPPSAWTCINPSLQRTHAPAVSNSLTRSARAAVSSASADGSGILHTLIERAGPGCFGASRQRARWSLMAA